MKLETGKLDSELLKLSLIHIWDVRFLSRQEIRALEHVYPEYLRDEVWHVLSGEDLGYDVFKERENVRNK